MRKGRGIQLLFGKANVMLGEPREAITHEAINHSTHESMHGGDKAEGNWIRLSTRVERKPTGYPWVDGLMG